MRAPAADKFSNDLLSGEPQVLEWLQWRCAQVANPQFSAWAWEWIREDFVSDLVTQLTSAARKDSFELRGDAGAYVDTAIRNLCGRYFRELARTRLHAPIEAVQEAGLSVGADKMAGILAVIDLRRALDQMSPECRDLLEKKYVVGRSLAEIGAEAGIQAKTARSRLHSCRERLREFWKKSST